MRLFADLSRNLGELSGTLQGAKEALQANAQETKENTKALQEGKQTFAEIKGELSHIKKTAPCLNGLPLPPNCAATTQNMVLPAQATQQCASPAAEDVAAEGARWLIGAIRLARENKLSVGACVVGVCTLLTGIAAWWKSLGAPH